jgi:hypothetical protein
VPRVSASRVRMDALADPAGRRRLPALRDARQGGAGRCIIDHEFDQLRDAAAGHGAEALLVAVADAGERLIERFEARRSETSERLREEILHPRREHIFRGGDERVMKA